VALLIRGTTKCPLCELVIADGQRAVGFPAFVSNEADPLWKFSDGAFHEDCVRRDDLAIAAERRLQRIRENNQPGRRRCRVCQRSITDPEDYFPLGHLTDDAEHPLHRFNFLHLHRTCLGRWSELGLVAELASKQLESGEWKGEGMERLEKSLRAARKE
jgi:hypothetical protein